MLEGAYEESIKYVEYIFCPLLTLASDQPTDPPSLTSAPPMRISDNLKRQPSIPPTLKGRA